MKSTVGGSFAGGRGRSTSTVAAEVATTGTLLGTCYED